MVSRMRKSVFVAVLSLASLGAAAPASAGMPVIDVANLAQAIQQVLSWGQQLQGMTQQYTQLVRSYEQLESTYNSLTGPRGMQNLLTVSLANRNYLPANYAQMTGVINGTSSAYPALSSQVQTTIQTNAILSTQGVSGLSPQAQQYVRQSRQAAATLSMLSAQNQANASNNFGNVQTLIGALGGTADTKASADLNGRIQSEQVMTQTNQDGCPLSKCPGAAIAECAARARGGREAAGRPDHLDADHLVAVGDKASAHDGGVADCGDRLRQERGRGASRLLVPATRRRHAGESDVVCGRCRTPADARLLERRRGKAPLVDRVAEDVGAYRLGREEQTLEESTAPYVD